jgi:copper chaperone CopZ
VKTEEVEIGKAVVTFDPAVVEPSAIERAVTEEGYPAHFVMAP